MAPQLAPSQREQIHAMILHELSNDVIAETVECSERAVRRIRSRLQRFGTTTSPPNCVGRETKITPLMRDALLEQLAKRPDMFRYEMIDFLYDSFGLEVSPTTLSRTLKTERWTRKTNGRVAKQRNHDLRKLYLYKLSDCHSYQLVFIDESSCDKRSGHRRQGWAPSGATPVQVDEFNREQRFQILAAYTQGGVRLARIYPGSTDAVIFEDFIEQLLLHCGKWPEPNSVLVMDNASIHRSERLEQMCLDAGIRLLKLAPYSPDMNPIEELFAEIKTYIKQERHNHTVQLTTCCAAVKLTLSFGNPIPPSNDSSLPNTRTFIDNIKDDLVSPVFTANLKHSIEGNYNFGYLNASEYIPNPNSSPEDQGIAYAPIDPKSVYWTFLATGYGVGPPIENFEPTAKTGNPVVVGQSLMAINRTYTAIADTGTTLLLVPSQIVRAYYARVTGSVYDPFWAGMIIPCEAELPDFSFYIGPGGSTYRGVVPGRYMNYVSFNGSHCYGGIQSSDGIGFAVFGALLIKSQFVVFDVGGKRIGFAGKELAT